MMLGEALEKVVTYMFALCWMDALLGGWPSLMAGTVTDAIFQVIQFFKLSNVQEEFKDLLRLVFFLSGTGGNARFRVIHE
ncbi:hypothetical protein AACH28_24975 [Sphingobacterium thalpophilum]|uniref:Uncharacterized protein n=2 Tax=Sphingobacterium TaxID=28453 RepID=A0ACD5C1T9_9SPHI